VLGTWLSCHYAARALQRRAPSWFSGVRSRLENDVCATFCAAGCVAFVARLSLGHLDEMHGVYLCLSAAIAVGVIALVRRLSRPRGLLRRASSSLSTLAPVLALPWPLLHIAGVFGTGWRVVLAALLLPALYAASFLWTLLRREPRSGTRVRRAFAHGTVPFFAFPGLCPIANEIDYTLSQRHTLEPQSVALVFVGLLTIAAALLFWAALSGRSRFAPGRLLSRFVFPAIVFGAVLISVYEHQFGGPQVGALYDAEQIAPVQQLLYWGKWPFLHVWPAHGLFDYLGALYSKVNGFHPFEMMAWNGVLTALSATASYAILARVSTPFFAVCVLALLPFEAIFPLPEYSYFYAEPGLLLVGLLLDGVFRRPSPQRYALLSAVTFLCFFWTPTSGVACILSVFALLLLSLITDGDRRVAWRGLGVFAATGLLVFALYGVALLVAGQPLLGTLRLIKAFMQADPLIGGRASVIRQFDSRAFVQYLLLPGIGLLYLGTLARHAIERRPLQRVERMLGFLALVSFVLFARTLTRHGLVERFQPFYFPLLALALLMKGADKALARAWFCVGLALYLVMFPVDAPRRIRLEPFAFRDWQRHEPRVTGVPPAYPELGAFLGATLRPDQTFLELLNNPLLYTIFQREVPGQFFLISMFYATDAVEDAYLERLQAFGGSARVPVVLLPGSTKERGNNIDGIPSSLRSYRIVEHVQRHYVPFGRMEGMEVWVSRELYDLAGKAVHPLSLSWREPEAYQAQSIEASRVQGDVLRLVAKARDAQVSGVVALDGVRLGGLESAHALRFLYRASASGTLALSIRYADRDYNASDASTVALPASDEWRVGQLPIPPRGESGIAVTGVRINPSRGAVFELEAPELVYGDPPPRPPETYGLDMLPFFWGTFDPPRRAAPELSETRLAVPPDNPALKAFDLTVDAAVDKSTGNYLQLCLRLPNLSLERVNGWRSWKSIQHDGGWRNAGKVTLTYGEPPSKFDFVLVSPDPTAPGLPRALVDSFERECQRYLVRLSAQYAWNSQRVAQLHIEASTRVILESAALLPGD
jgi:hypothetical protein